MKTLSYPALLSYGLFGLRIESKRRRVAVALTA